MNVLSGGITSTTLAAAVYGVGQLASSAYKSFQSAGAQQQAPTDSSAGTHGLAGLQFADVSGGSVSDAPRYAASTSAESHQGIDMGHLYEKTFGLLDKTLAITAVTAAGAFVTTVGGYLIYISPALGPVAGLIVAFNGFVLVGGGSLVLGQVPKIFSGLFLELSPRVPAVPAR